MSLKPTVGSDKEFEVVPEGVHTSRCVGIIDLGSHKSPFPDEKTGEDKYVREVMLRFEVLTDGVKREDGKPFIAQQKFNNSLWEGSKLRDFLESWRGRPFQPEDLDTFEFAKLADVYATIQVFHKPTKAGRLFPLIKTALPFSATKKPEGTEQVVVYDIDDSDEETLELIPKFLREEVESSVEWQQKHQESKSIEGANMPRRRAAAAEPEDDLGNVDIVHPVDDETPINLDDIPF